MVPFSLVNGHFNLFKILAIIVNLIVEYFFLNPILEKVRLFRFQGEYK